MRGTQVRKYPRSPSVGRIRPGAGTMTGDRLDDPRRARLRERLEIIRTRSQKSSSWRSVTHYFSGLVNHEGVVPVKARLSREDLRFLASARDEVIAFCELGLRLLDLHQ